jgi:hypothetical protein
MSRCAGNSRLKSGTSTRQFARWKADNHANNIAALLSELNQALQSSLELNPEGRIQEDVGWLHPFRAENF